jgi:branched-chain amino acid transport system substrate-binding protein
LLGAGFWWFKNRSGLNLDGLSGSDQGQSGSDSTTSGSLQNRLSLGEKILVSADTNSTKQTGVEALAKGDLRLLPLSFNHRFKKIPMIQRH